MAKYLVMVYKNEHFELYRETEIVEFIPQEKMDKIKAYIKGVLNE